MSKLLSTNRSSEMVVLVRDWTIVCKLWRFCCRCLNTRCMNPTLLLVQTSAVWTADVCTGSRVTFKHRPFNFWPILKLCPMYERAVVWTLPRYPLKHWSVQTTAIAAVDVWKGWCLNATLRLNIGLFKHQQPIFERTLPSNTFDSTLLTCSAVTTTNSICAW